MSVSVQHVAQAQLSADEAAFLRERAFPLWYDHEAFAEAEVDRAKALFRRVFGLDEAQPLQGFLFQDALAMNPPEDRTRYFAMMLVAPSSSSSSSGGGGEEEQSAKKLVWLRAVVTIDTFQFAPERLSFHEFLAILSTYRNRDGPAYPSTSSDGGATPPPSSCCTRTRRRQLSRRALMMMTMLAEEESDEEDEDEDDEDDEEQDEDTKTS